MYTKVSIASFAISLWYFSLSTDVNRPLEKETKKPENDAWRLFSSAPVLSTQQQAGSGSVPINQQIAVRSRNTDHIATNNGHIATVKHP